MRDLRLENAAHRDVQAGLTASIASVAWTAVTAAVAVGVGITAGSVVLVAFGAVGGFDMTGSIALVVHFGHAVRHQEISDRRERVAHGIVSFGLLTVGLATLIASAVRLAAGPHAHESLTGLIASGASVVALGFLGARKRMIGRRIPSQALVTDGSLSLTGAATAACALVGLALEHAFSWRWADSIAAMCIGVIAIVLALLSLRRA